MSKRERERHYCPSCRAGIVFEPPLHCKHCGWHLITMKEWKTLSPLQQGFAFYMQSSWPTSELARAENPYAEGTPAYRAFLEGEQRGARSAQDGEE